MLVLDGGLATELQRRGFDVSGTLWSARLLTEAPEAIAQVQRDFLTAGAGVVTTATYQATHAGLRDVGLSGEQSDQLLRDAARRARQVTHGWSGAPTPLVVGSVGPFGAYLHDGSEYRGDYELTVAQLRRFHRRRLEVLADECDVLAVETIPQLREVEALAAELTDLGAPCWLSISARGVRLVSGESAAEAFAIAASIPTLLATGANCFHPDDAVPLASLAAGISGKPAVIYPNSGEMYAAAQWSGNPTSGVPVREWIDAGAGLVGGCCRTTPRDIARMADEIATVATRPRGVDERGGDRKSTHDGH